MKYKDILKEIAKKENISPKEVEREMQFALQQANLDCTPKEFIEKTSRMVIQKTIYSNIV